MPRPSTRAAKPPTTSRAPSIPRSERRSELIRLLAAGVARAVEASVAISVDSAAAGLALSRDSRLSVRVGPPSDRNGPKDGESP
jgi:hypothetical protein